MPLMVQVMLAGMSGQTKKQRGRQRRRTFSVEACDYFPSFRCLRLIAAVYSLVYVSQYEMKAQLPISPGLWINPRDARPTFTNFLYTGNNNWQLEVVSWSTCADRAGFGQTGV